MKERTILFNGDMVRATLSGQKTQTRRVVRRNASGRAQLAGRNWHLDDPDAVLACPFGQPGDRLWVRETFNLRTGLAPVEKRLTYRADGYLHMRGWTPSIHMPRWASRITLEVTGVRVERLQDISEADVLAEGITRWPPGFRVAESGPPEHRSRTFDVAADAYRWLWNSIHGPGSWDANPWVWVVEFKRVEVAND